jgi:Ca2+-binding EF-hand superfamily protein
MGGGASCTAEEQSNLPLIKLEYLAQLKKPIDGSDCNDDLILAKSEISKLRTLCRSIDPSLVEEFFNKQQEQQDKRARDEVEKNERKQSEEKEEHSIVNLLKEKLDNRLVSLQEAFRKIDTTNTGFITKEEFIQVCGPPLFFFSLSSPYLVGVVLLVLGNSTRRK